MAEFKLTINDPKTGKSFHKVIDTDIFKNKKIKDKVLGDAIGLKGYELEITGGSDKAGFPMRWDLSGGRKRVLLTRGPGLRIRKKGLRKRKIVVGNLINLQTAQINLKIIKEGTKKLEELFETKKTAEEK